MKPIFFHFTTIFHIWWFLEGDEPEDADTESPKVYESIKSFDVLKERLQMYLGLYNESVRGGLMDLVFFKVTCVLSIYIKNGSLNQYIKLINVYIIF